MKFLLHKNFRIFLFITICVASGCKRNDDESLAEIYTMPVVNIRSHLVACGGNIVSDGGHAVNARGVCWSTSPNPTLASSHTNDGAGTGHFISTATGLLANTHYFIKAYATNQHGTSYGSELSFTTLAVPIVTSTTGVGVTDINGNNYSSIILGNGQEWMAENLATNNFTNGDPIALVTDTTAWQNINTPAWTYSNGNALTEDVYGKLYNSYAITDTRELCPAGWHIPTNDEWNQLVQYLDSDADLTCTTCFQSLNAGGQLKVVGTEYWQSPNDSASNQIGFSALPGGNRYMDGTYKNFNQKGFWWSDSWSGVSNYLFAREVYFSGGNIGQYSYHPSFGLSVRCLKD